MAKDKEFKNVKEQISIQEKRGLKVKSREKMKSFILRRNYFNSINGFESIFLSSSNPKKYLNRISFEDIKRMYNLDRRIAIYLFHEIENIEVELKTRIAHEFAKANCSTGVGSNLNYLDINYYTQPTRANSNAYTKFFYNSGNNKKTHAFFKTHKIWAKLSSIEFNGNVSSQGDFYYLDGGFSGTVDDLKNNSYKGKFKVHNNDAPTSITSQVGPQVVTINNISGLKGQFMDLSYADFCKIKFPYISSYGKPPLWVVINTLMLNDVLVLFQGLGNQIQNRIISEMGFDSTQSGSREQFVNACEILHELRNHLAHFGLVTRYRTSNKIRINNIFIRELSLTPKTNNKIIRFYQCIKVLNYFNGFSMKKIDKAISLYRLKNIFLFKHRINKKFFERIGK